MSDTSAFLAGCATTGVAVLVLLVARIGLDDTPPQIESIVPGQESPVPLPPPPLTPPTPSGEQADSNLRRELERQQDVSEQLKQQIDEHRATIRTLEDRLERQREDTNAIAADLRDTQRTVNDLANQPPLPPPARGTDSPTTLLWVGSAVVVIVLGGGGLLLLLVVNLLNQSPRRRRRPHLIYPQPPTPPSYPYYGPEILPPSLSSRPVVYDTYDYED